MTLASRKIAWISSWIASASFGQLPGNVQVTQAFGTLRFDRAVWMGEIPGKKGHFLVAEQGAAANADSARLWVIQPEGSGHAKRGFAGFRVKRGMGEMGLLGCAFHPQFATNRKYYVHYNPNTSPDSSLIEERTADATLLKDAGAPPRRILGLRQPSEYHNGGTLQFGPDGYLYIGFGDGGAGAGGKNNLLGAILRVDVDRPAGGLGYGIPADNPFAGDSDPQVRKEIWVYGLRNPWKFSFDPLNGDLWIGDVGQSTREEINLARKGEHLGWSVMEGTLCYNNPSCNRTGLTLPVTDLNTTQARCIVGGLVYRGSPNSAFYGAHIFADHITRKVFALTQRDRTLVELREIALAPLEISSLAADSEGNVYLVGYGYGAGPIYKLNHPQLGLPIRPFRAPFRILPRQGLPGNGKLRKLTGESLPDGPDGPAAGFYLTQDPRGVRGVLVLD